MSNKRSHQFLLYFAFLAITSCQLFEYHPYETNVKDENKDLNAKAINIIKSDTPAQDTVTFISMGDTQRWYNEVADFVESANRVKADFVILNGDISDFGLKDEFEWVHEIMKRLNKPYVAVVGNHDLSGNGSRVYSKMYGPLNSSFIVNRFKFILLDANSREYKFNGKVPDINWLSSELNGNDFDRAVVVSHVPPTDYDYDPDLVAPYNEALELSKKVNLSLHAHQHSFSDKTPFSNGIQFLTSTSMEGRMYLLIKLVNDKVTYEKIYF